MKLVDEHIKTILKVCAALIVLEILVKLPFGDFTLGLSTYIGFVGGAIMYKILKGDDK